jgi:hypothetical protein
VYGDGAWADPQMNTLLRISGKPVSVEKMAKGVGELLVDYLQLIDPRAVEEQMQSLDAAGKAKMLNSSLGK